MIQQPSSKTTQKELSKGSVFILWIFVIFGVVQIGRTFWVLLNDWAFPMNVIIAVSVGIGMLLVATLLMLAFGWQPPRFLRAAGQRLLPHNTVLLIDNNGKVSVGAKLGIITLLILGIGFSGMAIGSVVFGLLFHGTGETAIGTVVAQEPIWQDIVTETWDEKKPRTDTTQRHERRERRECVYASVELTIDEGTFMIRSLEYGGGGKHATQPAPYYASSILAEIRSRHAYSVNVNANVSRSPL